MLTGCVRDRWPTCDSCRVTDKFGAERFRNCLFERPTFLLYRKIIVLRRTNFLGNENNGVTFNKTEQLLFVFSAICAAVLLGQYLYFSRYGFDVTDESFYLYWIADPRSYDLYIPTSLFGFVYHPLYVLLGGNVAEIRQANVLISFGLALGVTYSIFKQFWELGRERIILVTVSFSVATCSLLCFEFWLITPNYNTLAFQSLALAAWGILLFRENSSYKQFIGCVCVAVGGLLAFLAKPTTAAVLALIVLVYGFVFLRRRWKLFVFSGLLACVLLVLAALFIDRSISLFVLRLSRSVDVLRLLGSGQDISHIFRIDTFIFTQFECYFVAAVSVFVIISSLPCVRKFRAFHWVLLLICFVLGVASVIYSFSDSTEQVIRKPLFFAVVILVSIVIILIHSIGEAKEMPTELWALAGLFLALPYAYAFGTNNNYWGSESNAALFWVLSALILLGAIVKKQGRPQLMMSVAFIVIGMTTLAMVYAINNPYRQPIHLRSDADAFNLRSHGNLILSAGFHSYFSDSLSLARKAGFGPGMPMIDLSGQSPGLLYVLGAKSLGQPWLVGFYPGSDRVAIVSLADESCAELGAAWLLEEPGGPGSLSVGKILRTFGAQPDDYRIVSVVFTPSGAGAGGYTKPRKQYFLKPLRSADAASQACLLARKNNMGLKHP